MELEDKATEIAKSIKLLVLDVDGVLTDGGIYFDENGVESKRFNALDGYGITMLLSSGVEVAIISGRKSKCVTYRMKDLGVKYCYQARINKTQAFEELIAKLGLKPNQVAYVGDDTIDLPVMYKVALPIAVANAQKCVKEYATFSTQNTGGNGAVREVCDYILIAQNKYNAL